MDLFGERGGGGAGREAMVWFRAYRALLSGLMLILLMSFPCMVSMAVVLREVCPILGNEYGI